MDKESFRKTLARTAELISADAKIRAGAAGVQFSVLFEVTDLDLKFFMDFGGSEVKASVGEVPTPPMVELGMESGTFDAIFTGELDAMSAAMSGDMSFSGDAGPAMALQDLMDEFIRVYKQAKGEVQ